MRAIPVCPSALAPLVLIAGMIVASASGVAEASTRSTAMIVRVNVARSCVVDSRGSGATAGAVAVTCTRSGTAPDVVSTIAGNRSITRVVPVPTLRTTIVASRPAMLAAAGLPTPGRAAQRQVVTLNF